MAKKPVFTREGNEIKCHLLKHQLAAKDSKKQIAGIVGGRGCGKSIFLSSMTVLEMLQGGKVLLFAQNYKSLSLNLFKEIKDRFYECGLEPYVNNGNMSIKFNKGELYGFSYENIDSVRGLSECSLLVLDELALAPKNLFETVTPCLRGAKRDTRILFATTPKKGSIWNKWFRNTAIDKDIFTGTMFDIPDDIITKEEKDLQKNAIKDEAAFQQEMMGVILDDDVEFCVLPRKDFPTLYKGQYGVRKLGIDCAGSGSDYNVFVVTDDNGILETYKIQKADTYQLHSTAFDLIKKWNVKRVNIDTTGGFGNGLLDMLKMSNTNIEVCGINFGQKAIKDCYANARAEMYFEMAEKVRNGFFVDNEEIKEELSYTSYVINGSGKTQLVKKEIIKELLGHSPDITDAFCLSLYDSVSVNEISEQESLNIAMKFVGI